MLYFDKKWDNGKNNKNSTNPVFTGIWKDLRTYEREDKSIIYLPRQVTKTMLKTFENQGFFYNPIWIYDTFTTDEVKLW